MADVTYQTAVALAQALISDVRALIAQVTTLKSSVDTTATTVSANAAAAASSATAAQTAKTQVEASIGTTKLTDLDASALSTSMPSGSKKLYIDANGFLKVTP